MIAPTSGGARPGYFATLGGLLKSNVAPLVQPASHSRRSLASRRLARDVLVLAGIGTLAIILLMVGLDAREIAWMPARGAPELWSVRIITEFGKAGYVLWTLAGLLLACVLTTPLLPATARLYMNGWIIRLQFVLFAVLVPVMVGEVLKWLIGRGRPFVGGPADPFNFHPFDGTQAYASLPSSHSITAAALALAIAAIWPRLSLVAAAYGVLIMITRLVLLAHHPSDVVAGALVGLIGALVVRYWFASRKLGFVIRPGGEIAPRG